MIGRCPRSRDLNIHIGGAVPIKVMQLWLYLYPPFLSNSFDFRKNKRNKTQQKNNMLHLKDLFCCIAHVSAHFERKNDGVFKIRC